MRLSAESHDGVEQFFREHLNEPGLRLPRVNFYGGSSGRLVITFLRGMDAITLGRNVFVRPEKFVRDGEGRATLPGWLVIHESRHVLQYEAMGYPRFFRDYLGNYWRALREGGRWDKAGRMAAYMTIAEEREAREAATAYAASRPGADSFTLT
jgi:hypothetical protein